MNQRLLGHFKTFGFFLRQTEDWLLVVLLFLMIMTAVAQIALRNFFGGGIVWAEPFTRTLVLWTTLVGAMIGARTGKHIRMGFMAQYFKGRSKQRLIGMADLITSFVAAGAVYYTFQFVVMEYEYSNVGFAHVPSWICSAIIPFSFAVMSLRYLISSIFNLLSTSEKS